MKELLIDFTMVGLLLFCMNGLLNNHYIQNEMAGLEYLHNYYTRKFNEIETEIQRIKTLNDDLDIKRDNELKELDGRLYKLNSDKESLLNSIKFNEANSNAIDKFVNSKETSEKLNDLKREKESLEKENEGYKTWISAHKSNYYTIDFYHGNIVETAFNEWIEKGMPL